MVADETRRLQQELASGQARQQSLQQEIRLLRAKLHSLEAAHAEEEVALNALRQQLETLQTSANSASFLDQAAENEKNDLLARKVLLGLE